MINFKFDDKKSFTKISEKEKVEDTTNEQLSKCI